MAKEIMIDLSFVAGVMLIFSYLIVAGSGEMRKRKSYL